MPMQSMNTAATLALAAALVGCATPDRMQGAVADGVRCGEQDAGAVYLEVRYAADGLPQVEPAVCEIARGTRVTWRGPAYTPVDFRIRFKGASPVEGEPRGVFASESGQDRHRAVRVLDAAAGRYDYAVIANGRELDPAIIIR